MNKRIFELPDAGALDLNQRIPVEMGDGTGGTKRQTIGRILEFAGLKPYNSNRLYTADEAFLYGGKIRIATQSQTGTYDPEKSVDYNQTIDGLGIPPWLPEEEITFNPSSLVQRSHRNAIYEAIESNTGIEPGVHPEWETYWQIIIYTEGGIVPIYSPGFVKFNTVYQYQGVDMPHGLYRCNFIAAGFDGGFKSTNFQAELSAGKWVLVAPKIGLITNVQFGIPDSTYDESKGYRVGYIIKDPSNAVEYECIYSATGAAVWRKICGNLSSDSGFLSTFSIDGTGIFDLTILSYFFSKSGSVLRIVLSGNLSYSATAMGVITIPLPEGFRVADVYVGHSVQFRIAEFISSCEELFVEKNDSTSLAFVLQAGANGGYDFNLVCDINIES